MNNKRFAIVGCGRAGHFHAQAIRAIKNAELLYVCDEIKDRARNFYRLYEARAYTDSFEKLLDYRFDVLTVATPHDLHHDMAVAALRKNRDVILEKPVCLTKAQYHSLLVEQEKSKGNVYPVLQCRYNPAIKAFRDKVQKIRPVYNVVCETIWHRPNIYFLDWHGSKKRSGGPLFTQFLHHVDLLIWCFGKPNKLELTTTSCRELEFEDSGLLTMLTDRKTLCSLNYTISFPNKNAASTIKAYGKFGKAEIDMSKLRNNQYSSYTGSVSNHKELFDDVVNWKGMPLEAAKESLFAIIDAYASLKR